MFCPRRAPRSVVWPVLPFKIRVTKEKTLLPLIGCAPRSNQCAVVISAAQTRRVACKSHSAVARLEGEVRVGTFASNYRERRGDKNSAEQSEEIDCGWTFSHPGSRGRLLTRRGRALYEHARSLRLKLHHLGNLRMTFDKRRHLQVLCVLVLSTTQLCSAETQGGRYTIHARYTCPASQTPEAPHKSDLFAMSHPRLSHDSTGALLRLSPLFRGFVTEVPSLLPLVVWRPQAAQKRLLHKDKFHFQHVEIAFISV